MCTTVYMWKLAVLNSKTPVILVVVASFLSQTVVARHLGHPDLEQIAREQHTILHAVTKQIATVTVGSRYSESPKPKVGPVHSVGRVTMGSSMKILHAALEPARVAEVPHLAQQKGSVVLTGRCASRTEVETSAS